MRFGLGRRPDAVSSVSWFSITSWRSPHSPTIACSIAAAGAILALPAAAILQAIVGVWGERHEVIESQLTVLTAPGRRPSPKRT